MIGHKVLTAAKRIFSFSEHIATACMLLGAALNLVNIIGRYIFYASIPWAEEVMIYLMIAGVFFGAAQASLNAVHISMDIFIRDMPPRLKLAIILANDLILLFIAAVVIWQTLPVVMQLYHFDQRSEAARLPIYIPQMIIPLGFLLMMIGTCLHRISALIDPQQANGNQHI